MGRPRKHPRRWYRCTQSFGGFNEDGTPNDCQKGILVPETDPRVKANPDCFEALDADYPVEQATATAGEQRER